MQVMVTRRQRLLGRLRWGRRRLGEPEPEPGAPAAAPSPSADPHRGLGAPSSEPAGEADEAELDTLRGELVRELDRIAAREGR
jgi:hypothetical protein